MTAAKKVYLVQVVPARDQKWTPSSTIGKGPCCVYGDDDLKRRKQAAKEAGVTLRVELAPNL